MIETGWDNDSNMMDTILTLEHTYEEELQRALGPGVPLMVTSYPPLPRRSLSGERKACHVHGLFRCLP